MKTTTRVTKKGQVTIPQQYRVAFGILPNSEVEFVVSNDMLVVKKSKKTFTRGKAITERLCGTGTSGYTTDEIMSLTRK